MMLLVLTKKGKQKNTALVSFKRKLLSTKSVFRRSHKGGERFRTAIFLPVVRIVLQEYSALKSFRMPRGKLKMDFFGFPAMF